MSCKTHGARCHGHAAAAKDDRAVLEIEELERLIVACKTPEEKAVLLLAYDLALRSAEISQQTLEDVDLDARAVACRRVKDGRISTIGISARTRDALAPLMQGRTTRHIFPQWGPRRFQRWFVSLVKRCGLPATPGRPGNKSYSHVLRRSRATHLHEAGAEIKDIQRRLGHKSAKTTLLYLGLTEKRKQLVDSMAAAILDGPDSPPQT